MKAVKNSNQTVMTNDDQPSSRFAKRKKETRKQLHLHLQPLHLQPLHLQPPPHFSRGRKKQNLLQGLPTLVTNRTSCCITGASISTSTGILVGLQLVILFVVAGTTTGTSTTGSTSTSTSTAPPVQGRMCYYYQPSTTGTATSSALEY
jgi:hypothetical protein